MTTSGGPDAWPWRGIFAIPVTPFLPSGAIDYASLEQQVDFCIASGVHGLVYPAVVSEFFALTDAERQDATTAVVKAAAGRVPVVVGVSAPSTAWRLVWPSTPVGSGRRV